MTVLDPPLIQSAQSVAEANFSRNAAMFDNLPAMPPLPELNWLWGRDGTLTCKRADGEWLLGNSLPRRTAERMLRDLHVTHSVCCFLDVPHAAFLKTALERLGPRKAIVAVVPDALQAKMMLHCEDFSEAAYSHRLWIAAGDNWLNQLTEIFRKQTGLPTPSAFVRTSLSDEAALQKMIDQAQRVFATESGRRQQIIAGLASADVASTKQGNAICLIAPSTFHLWDPAAETLANILPAIGFDPDDPISASPLALAIAASEGRAVVAANIARADARGLVSPSRPWITWITRPIIPAYVDGPSDHLLLADPNWSEVARRAGWPAKQIDVAGWPMIMPPSVGGQYVGLIADTCAVDVEPDHFDLSSHALLWETLRHLLMDNPFDLREEPSLYLSRRMAHYQVAPDGLDQSAFIERLIIPTYQQSIARLLIGNGMPIRLFGHGWELMAEFAAHAAGAINSSVEMKEAITGATALIHVSPGRCAHPIDAVCRPVIRTSNASAASIIRDTQLAIAGKLPLQPAVQPPISADLILSLLR